MAVLDSSAIIEILSGTDSGIRIQEKFGPELSTTTTICIFEVLLGATSVERAGTEQFLYGLDILSFDKAAAEKSVEIEQQLKKKGKMIPRQDIFIAAMCLTQNMPLITCDKDFQNVEGLTTRYP